MPNIDLSILNQRATPAFFADTLANRPAPSFVGRIFISTDTLDLYRDTGSAWLLLSPSSTGTITGSGAAGQVTIFSGASSITGTNNLFWDTSNLRLGINTNTPGAALDLHSTASTLMQLNQTTATNDTRIAFQNSGTALWRIGNFYNAGANDWGIFDVVGAAQPFTIKKTTGQTFIGAETTSSGRLVVNNTTGDNHIVVIGATAPSIRINNAGSGATRQIGIGLATTTNNFIQGTTGGEMAIFNSNTTASPILFGIYDAGLSNTQEAARISAARNFIIGSSVDAGFKLDVNGAARVTGVVYADNSIRVGNGIIGTNSNNLLLSSNTTGGEISFWNNQLANRLMTLTGSGNLGIQVAAPTHPLNTSRPLATVWYPDIKVGGYLGNLPGFIGSSNGSRVVISGGAEQVNNDASTNWAYAYNSSASFLSVSDSGLKLFSDSGLTPTATYTPTQRLSITNTGAATFSSQVDANIFNASSQFRLSNNNVLALSTISGNNVVKINAAGYYGTQIVGANDTGILVGNTGNTLIGTTTDAGDKLQVQGGIVSYGTTASGIFFQDRSGSAITGFYTTTGLNVYTSASGIVGIFNLSTGVYTPTSDKNKKKNFEKSNFGLDAVLKLKPTLYNMINQNDNESKELGFIAQEVKEVIEQAYIENGEFIGLNYQPIVATLVKAIQELNTKIENLKN